MIITIRKTSYVTVKLITKVRENDFYIARRTEIPAHHTETVTGSVTLHTHKGRESALYTLEAEIQISYIHLRVNLVVGQSVATKETRGCSCFHAFTNVSNLKKKTSHFLFHCNAYIIWIRFYK